MVGNTLDGEGGKMSFASLHGATDAKGASRYHIDKSAPHVPIPSNDPKIDALFRKSAVTNQRDLSTLSQESSSSQPLRLGDPNTGLVVTLINPSMIYAYAY